MQPPRAPLAVPSAGRFLHIYPLPVAFACDSTEVAYRRPAWLTGRCHPSSFPLSESLIILLYGVLYGRANARLMYFSRAPRCGPGDRARGGRKNQRRRGRNGARQGASGQGLRGSLEPPGPLLTRLHTASTEYSACLPTLLSPLAKRTFSSQVHDPSKPLVFFDITIDGSCRR